MNKFIVIFCAVFLCILFGVSNNASTLCGIIDIKVLNKKGNTNDVTLPVETQKKIDNLINKGIEEKIYPGAVVLVAKGHDILYKKAFGYSQVTPKKRRMTTETLFDVASMTKCVCTAPAIMKLLEENRISLHDPVKKYIPSFKPWNDGKSVVDITIQQLLTHSSGLSAGISSSEITRLRKQWKGYNSSKLVSYIATKTTRNYRPGTRRLYSCINYVVLQAIIEKVSGKRLSDYAQTNLFKPLAMSNTRFFPEGDNITNNINIATTTVINGYALKGQVHDPLARLLNGGVSGNAGLFTTAGDLAKFSFFILYGKEGVLKKQTIKRMITIPSSERKTVGRALGWEVNSSYVGGLRKDYCICHTGYTGTSIVIDLDAQTTIILLTNRVHPKDSSIHKKRLMSIRKQLSDIIASQTI